MVVMLQVCQVMESQILYCQERLLRRDQDLDVIVLVFNQLLKTLLHDIV
jgi:hypothetical protein